MSPQHDGSHPPPVASACDVVEVAYCRPLWLSGSYHARFSEGMQLRWRNGEPGSSDKAVGSKCGRVDKPARNCSFATRFDCVAVTQLVTDVLYYEWRQ